MNTLKYMDLIFFSYEVHLKVSRIPKCSRDYNHNRHYFALLHWLYNEVALAIFCLVHAHSIFFLDKTYFLFFFVNLKKMGIGFIDMLYLQFAQPMRGRFGA